MRDWHAERYAAGEALAKAARSALARITEHVLWDKRAMPLLDELQRCLDAYEKTKDAP